MGFADIDAVFQEIGERTVSEGDAAVVLGSLGVATLGDDVPAVEFSNKPAERLQFQVQAEDGADGLSLQLVDDELLVFGVIAERNGPTGPAPISARSLLRAGRSRLPPE